MGVVADLIRSASEQACSPACKQCPPRSFHIKLVRFAGCTVVVRLADCGEQSAETELWRVWKGMTRSRIPDRPARPHPFDDAIDRGASAELLGLLPAALNKVAGGSATMAPNRTKQNKTKSWWKRSP